MSRLEEIRNQRLDKLKKLREVGINPYPSHAKKDLPNQTVIDEFAKYDGQTVTLAGRLMTIRSHGKISFADLADQSGQVQLVFRESQCDFPDLSLLDTGDFVQAEGKVMKTRTGQISLDVIHLTLLTKSLRPLPDKEGLTDKELIFRRRYLDLALNPERREMFLRKAKFWEANRRFLTERGFIEVETPVLEHVTGGADAKPFTTHHHALDTDFYLRISTELFQKRLIGGGFEKVFTLAPNFRNEGIDDEHLQEYYQIEWYWAYADYRDNMAMLVEMFRYIAKEVYGTTKFEKGKHTFDLANDWEEIDFAKTIQEKLGVNIFKDPDEKMAKVLLEHKVRLDGGINRARLIDNLWKVIRKDISGPAFLINEPKFMSPLAKSKPDNEALTERFHIIIAGSELGNGYSELNDPLDQLERFQAQQNARDAGDDEAQMLDIDFVEMLEYGMPPTSGYAHSERLFWFLENVTAREGTLFPQTRRFVEPLTRKIYNLPKDKKEK
jgi:lysyl-tRNA synthetase class 2